jgi:hypothetical protein
MRMAWYPFGFIVGSMCLMIGGTILPRGSLPSIILVVVGAVLAIPYATYNGVKTLAEVPGFLRRLRDTVQPQGRLGHVMQVHHIQGADVDAAAPSQCRLPKGAMVAPWHLVIRGRDCGSLMVTCWCISWHRTPQLHMTYSLARHAALEPFCLRMTAQMQAAMWRQVVLLPGPLHSGQRLQAGQPPPSATHCQRSSCTNQCCRLHHYQ